MAGYGNGERVDSYEGAMVEQREAVDVVIVQTCNGA